MPMKSPPPSKISSDDSTISSDDSKHPGAYPPTLSTTPGTTANGTAGTTDAGTWFSRLQTWTKDALTSAPDTTDASEPNMAFARNHPTLSRLIDTSATNLSDDRFDYTEENSDEARRALQEDEQRRAFNTQATATDASARADQRRMAKGDLLSRDGTRRRAAAKSLWKASTWGQSCSRATRQWRVTKSRYADVRSAWKPRRVMLTAKSLAATGTFADSVTAVDSDEGDWGYNSDARSAATWSESTHAETEKESAWSGNAGLTANQRIFARTGKGVDTVASTAPTTPTSTTPSTGASSAREFLGTASKLTSLAVLRFNAWRGDPLAVAGLNARENAASAADTGSAAGGEASSTASSAGGSYAFASGWGRAAGAAVAGAAAASLASRFV